MIKSTHPAILKAKTKLSYFDIIISNKNKLRIELNQHF